MTFYLQKKYHLLIGALISIGVLLLPTVTTVELGYLEIISFIAYGWSTWLLANNRPLGWWVGFIGIIGYMYIFFIVRFYAETAIQTFYLITSFQAIYIWLKGGDNHTEKPVSYAPRKYLWLTSIAFVVSVLVMYAFLTATNDAAPFWDSLTTAISFIAQIYLMQRYVESWYLWILVDIIYLPLYSSQSLYLTSILYVGLLLMSINGLRNFKKILKEQSS